jgi:hypothetical protein
LFQFRIPACRSLSHRKVGVDVGPARFCNAIDFTDAFSERTNS